MLKTKQKQQQSKQTYKKKTKPKAKPDLAGCANPSAEEVETGSLRLPGQPTQHQSPGSVRESVLKYKMDSN